MSQYPQCEHEHSNPNFACPQCELEQRLSDLESLCAELKNALAEANDADAIAEADDSANFLHRRREFDELATRAGQLLKQKHP